jgi:glycosyltransferase involved in cell wall biosynthesis
MTTYNHERYITTAIQSVLDQTFRDFELVIVNDGSTDGTGERIRRFGDQRIVYLPQQNQGPSLATNNAILASRGRYVALTSGDDVSYPRRLQRQIDAVAESSCNVIFSWFDFIDDAGRVIPGHFGDGRFDIHNRSRAEYLRDLFFKGNFLHDVTALIDRQALLEAGLYDVATIQLQDFDMHLKLLTNHDFFVVPERLVGYRMRSDRMNLSKNSVRTVFELCQVYRRMLDRVPIELFREAFKDQVRTSDFNDGVELELEKAFVYLSHDQRWIQSLASEKLFGLFQNPEVRVVAKTRYSLGLPQLYDLYQGADGANIALVDELQRWIKELETAKDWLDEQRQNWIRTAEQTAAELDATRRWIKELETRKDWLDEQRQNWMRTAEQTAAELERTRLALTETQFQLTESRRRCDDALAIAARAQSGMFWKLRILGSKLKRFMAGGTR